MMVSIFVLLFMFGGGAALLGLIVFAIASKKLWIIPVGGALSFLCLMALGILPAIIFAPHHNVAVKMSSPTQVAQQVSGMTHTVVQGSPNFNASISGRPGWMLILIVVLLITFLSGLVGRMGMAPAAGHGFRRIGTAIAAILLIAIILLGSVRYTVSDVPTATVTRDIAMEMATQQQAIIAAQQQATDQVRKQYQQAQLDIHKAMDQFDAPHIPLRPNAASAEASEAPTPPTAPVPLGAVPKPKDTLAAKTNKNDAKKLAASKQKHKKPDQAPTTGGTQKSQSVAQSTSTDEKVAVKENTSSSDKLAMVAEAESEKSNARPAWVDDSPKRTGNTLREVIATEPYATDNECKQAANIYLLLKTYQRIQELVGRPYADDGAMPSVTFQNGKILADGKVVSYGRSYPYWADERIRELANMDIGTEYVRREIVAKDPKDNESRVYVETVTSSIGPMIKHHLQIEFTPAVDRELRRHWDAHERRERFATVGVGSLSVLGLLGVVFALLKIDTATKGYYTKRLFIGLPAAIIIGLLLLSLLMMSRPMRSESGLTVPLPQGYSG